MNEAISTLRMPKKTYFGIGAVQKVREAGVKREDFPTLVEIAFKWANEYGNPREVSKKQLRELYEKAY